MRALDTPWPKVVRTRDRDWRAWARRGEERRRRAVRRAAPTARGAPDAELPATGVTLERERMLSAPFIVSDDYGTRCSTVLTIDRDGRRPLRGALVRSRRRADGARVETFTAA